MQLRHIRSVVLHDASTSRSRSLPASSSPYNTDPKIRTFSAPIDRAIRSTASLRRCRISDGFIARSDFSHAQRNLKRITDILFQAAGVSTQRIVRQSDPRVLELDLETAHDVPGEPSSVPIMVFIPTQNLPTRQESPFPSPRYAIHGQPNVWMWSWSTTMASICPGWRFSEIQNVWRRRSMLSINREHLCSVTTVKRKSSLPRDCKVL